MQYIIKSPDELKDPFLCFCIFQRFCEESGEDYIDYNETIINAYPFSMWLFGKGYIDSYAIEKFFEKEKLFIEDILCSDILFPNTYGRKGIASLKIYSLLAEYMSSIKGFRQRLYDSVNDKAAFENNEFYKDENGISLACIISQKDLISEQKYTKESFVKSNKYIWDLTYREQWDLVTSMSIAEIDQFTL